jgi:short-subunit dehydrogenase
LERLADVERSIAARGGRAVAIAADVTAEADRQRLLKTAVEAFGGVDVLVNNAGVGSFGHFAESSEAVLRQVMEVNFFAPAELIRLAVPVLQHGRQPAIVNIASMCGRRALPAWPEYSASKFALCGLSEALRAELVRFGINVLLILPGLTQTDLGSHLLRNDGRMKIDFARGMKPEAVAARVLRALEGNQQDSVLGRDARLLLALNRFLPRLLDRLVARKVRRLYAAGQS